MASAYETRKVFAASQVIADFQRNGVFRYRGETYHLSTRLSLFVKKGTACVVTGCNVVGQFFALQKHKKQKTTKWHLNLYGRVSTGELMMLTMDHIRPKSLGGLTELDNLQCMCSYHNEKKGSTYGWTQTPTGWERLWC